MIEQPPALFNTLPMPLLIERYRDAVFHQLYENFSPIIFESLCWASSEIQAPASQHSHIAVFPGEERYMMLTHGIRFSHLNTRATACPYRKEETKVDVKSPLPTDTDSLPSVVSRKLHYCVLHHDRPLLCRMFPFGIQRSPANPREAVIVCDEKMLRSIHKKRGELAVNQMMHNVSQVVIALWAFLTPAWWVYYEGVYSKNTWTPKEVVRFTFEISDDVVISTVRGAPAEWRAQMLAEIASKECKVCEGLGIEFYDRTIAGVPLPVPQRRFDLCRTCVLPQIGARIGNLLVDPTSRKILDATGVEYRGDSVLLEDFYKPKKE